MPSAVNWCTQSKLFSRQYLRSVSLIFPIRMTFVFVMFTWRPDLTWNQSRISRLFFRFCSEASRNIEVSSAYWQSLCSLLCKVIPFTFLSFLKAKARYSEHKIKIYGDIGSPCLQPLSSGKGSDRYLLKIMRELEFSWNMLIHFFRLGPKLKLSSTSSMNSQERLSKAF